MALEINNFINKLRPNESSIKRLAEVLEYEVGNNPINDSSPWKILFTNKLPDYSKGVIAVKTEEDLTEDSKTVDIRRLYKQVEELKIEFSSSFQVEIVAFIGHKRIVFFPYYNGNRDTRLDLNPDTVQIPLYRKNFSLLANENVVIEEDEFGFGAQINLHIQEIFKKELSNHFRYTTNFYRKKLSELITATSLKNKLEPLLDDNATFYLERSDFINLVAERSFTAALGTVTDTIILRQLMRRFLEGYYGKSAFEVSGIALGVGDGTLDDAIKRSVRANYKEVEEKDILKASHKKTVIQNDYQQLSLFNLFDEDEQALTADIDEMSEQESLDFSSLLSKARKQFETIFDGDLFAGSIGRVANEIEEELSKDYPEFVAQMWVDTSSDHYSFRYEDLPPSAIEEHYENSMSQSIKINFEDGQPVVMYAETEAEQKQKGAYYTDHRFVDYIVKHTVEEKFDQLIEKIREADSDDGLYEAIYELLDFKISDLTCGGGSFLRGAFLKLASKHDILTSLPIPDDIKASYPMFNASSEGEMLWEEYLLNHVIYGVDFDYKAVLISSLTLSLSSIEHRDSTQELPNLIGKTLIHQNSLINSVPFSKRQEIYANYKDEIKILRQAKVSNSENYESLRRELQIKLLQEDYTKLAEIAEQSHIEAIEINLPEVFFNEEGELLEDPGFDCVIGNPPWEKNKPNSDEFYSNLDSEFPGANGNVKEKKQRIKELQEVMPFVEQKWEEYSYEIKLSNKYFKNKDNYQWQSYRINGRKTGGDPNLYIVSVERFDQLLKPNGYFSLIIPDNFATDANTTGIRHLIFDHYELKDFLSFENSKGIFPSVHRSYKFAVMRYLKQSSSNDFFDAFFYETDLRNLENQDSKLHYPIDLVKSSEDYTLIEPKNEDELNIVTHLLSSYEPLIDIDNFKFSTDFHKTNDSSYFYELNETLVPLYEGKFMNQFKIIPEGLKEGVEEKVAYDKIKDDYYDFRLAMRSVASATNQRTLIATLLPKYSVATNSLLVQKQTDLMSIDERLYYLSVLNSYLIDFILRKMVTTNLNKRYINKLPIAKYGELDSTAQLISISKELMMMNGPMYDDLDNIKSDTVYHGRSKEDLIAELNALIFKDYKITRNQIISIMKSFESKKHAKAVAEEAQRIINIYDQLTDER
ncbi:MULTISPECIES: Eco57I restriction-modification methylase domain-containing protein [Aerococcus]|uniref:site-specific DNA-methyltransferase (adenine-specific) n=1 Tax=Aerococcus urinae TaxID=1376 RepID=A0A329P360_9LACT|nr:MULTISPECIES: adenine methyltransferase [Aerococcus]MDK6729048.1 adenine methyltransferase [Aerococcus urinae]RAV81451.1 adenine methyltransferase [Aerococcus loyolae]